MQTIVTSTGKVLKVGDGNHGVIIVDAWTEQPVLAIDDQGDGKEVDVEILTYGDIALKPYRPGKVDAIGTMKEPVKFKADWHWTEDNSEYIREWIPV